MLKEFKTIEEAKEYAKDFRKYDQQRVLVDGKLTHLCGTCLVYEDQIWNAAYELFSDAIGLLGFRREDDPDDGSYGASLIRDAVLKAIEEVYDCKIVDVHSEY